MDVERLGPDQRKLVSGVQGRKLVFLSPDGTLQATTMKADLLELPRCPLDKVLQSRIEGHANLGSPEEVAEHAASRTGMEIACLVTWPPLGAGMIGPHMSFPEAMGLLLW